MKQFIYLDTDIVASIIAQGEKGLITQQIDEVNSSNISSDQKSEMLTGNVGGGAKIKALFNLNAGVSVEGDNTLIFSNQESRKKIVEKTIHDAAFDIAYDYIEPIEAGLEIEKSFQEGQYIEIKRKYVVIDLEYLSRISSMGGFIDYVKKSTETEIRRNAALTNPLSREQQRNSNIKKSYEKNLRKIIDEENRSFDDFSEMLRVYKDIIPYSRMIMSEDGFLVPLEDMYFRINPSNLGFKYGGQLTCVGLITNVIKKNISDEDNDSKKSPFEVFQYAINDSLRDVLQLSDDMIIVHPIAVYYGE